MPVHAKDDNYNEKDTGLVSEIILNLVLATTIMLMAQ